MAPFEPSSIEASTSTLDADRAKHFSFKNISIEDVLEDLSSRFILNLPEEELVSVERICFQVEQAHWYYEDYIRDEEPSLPSLPLKTFSGMLFQSCPLLVHWSPAHDQAFQDFMAYKTTVPVCGAIMIDPSWTKCVLVKGWKSSAAWSFPRGKINLDEPEHECAAREVMEETGYDISDKINLDAVIRVTVKDQRTSLFVIPNVPEDTVFETKTRKEISKIQWFNLSDLPAWKKNTKSPTSFKFYAISSFVG
ncbi:DCP2-domain-containing protein [Cantharellus anzutake]|uniref:DCP2-domain-containing protein n=1 Tax=Cantharellus anzutake TaxID=1750568 RepID=UPI001902C210|nr:DCP2-domain-containing protein [Cantharellus anzutake]KAF8324150.1 DCP2-domain-containing protein [Cantharellus anzutake]